MSRPLDPAGQAGEAGVHLLFSCVCCYPFVCADAHGHCVWQTVTGEPEVSLCGFLSARTGTSLVGPRVA